MKSILMAGAVILAILTTGCDSNGISQSALESSTSGTQDTGQPILDGDPGTPGCVPLTQVIAFSGSALIQSSSASSQGGSYGILAPGVVTSVINTGSSQTFEGSGSDGVIQFTAEAAGSNGLSSVQGDLEISSSEWNSILSQLADPSDAPCIQSITFNLEVAPNPDSGEEGAAGQMLYGGQVVVTAGGTQFSLTF